MADSAPSAAADFAQLKRCSRCDEHKAFAAFSKERCRPDGLATVCKECRKACYQSWYAVAKSGSRKAYREANRAELLEKLRAGYRKHKAKRDAGTRAWAERNREKVREVGKRAQQKYRATDHGRVRTRAHNSSPQVKLGRNIARGVRRGLSGGKGGNSTFALLGYTAQELMAHLERRFLPGMSWENYGTEWHVDHDIPLAAHNYRSTSDPDFQRAWALTNLQPMWARDNRIKGARLPAPFQPTFALGAEQ